MSVIEAILKYFKIDKAKIDCLQAYFDNNKTLVLIVSSILTIILLRFLGKELLLILIPIAISSVIANFFRNKDKEEAQSIRDRDKEDNDARNLRADLREYFLKNCKPIINEILKDREQRFKKYTFKQDEKDKLLDTKILQEYFDNYILLILELSQTFTPLLSFVKNASFKKYENRFSNYFNLTLYMMMLYIALINPEAMKLPTYNSLLLKQQHLINKITTIISLIDNIFAESELILFNYSFDSDKIIFEKHVDDLNNAILDTGLANAKEFLFGEKKWSDFILEMR